MLVLTRKQKEEIRIGDNVTITILRIKGQAVRIGIDAPQEIRVVRGELKARISDEASSVDESVEQPTEQSAPPLARFNSDLASTLPEVKQSDTSPVSAAPSSSCTKLLRQTGESKSCGAERRSACRTSLNTKPLSTLASLVQRRSQGFSSN